MVGYVFFSSSTAVSVHKNNVLFFFFSCILLTKNVPSGSLRFIILVPNNGLFGKTMFCFAPFQHKTSDEDRIAWGSDEF